MKDYNVSIIIPAYNASRYICRCVDSILAQTIESIQVIIINDGSTDETEMLCNSHYGNNNGVVIISKNNQGQGIARNYGLNFVKGEYVGFVDADDYVEPNMYEMLYHRAKDICADLVYSYMEGEQFLEDDFFKDYENGKIIYSNHQISKFRQLLIGGMPSEINDASLGMSVCRSIFNYSIIQKYGIRFISERKVNSEDLLFNLDFLEHCNCISTINNYFYVYCHDNPQSFSVKANDNRFKMFNNLYDELIIRSKCDEDILRATRRFLANIRIVVVEKARWCRISTLKKTIDEIGSIINDHRVKKILNEYPIESLPFMQKIYFYLMKHNMRMLLIIFAKLRYKFL